MLDVQGEQSEEPTEEYTKLRDGLIFSHHPKSGGEAAFVVKDPETDRFFRFKEVQYFIARQLDGVTSAETVRRRVEDAYQTPLSAEGLEQFVKSLRRLGLLEGERSAQRREKYQGLVRGSLLYLRIKLFDLGRPVFLPSSENPMVLHAVLFHRLGGGHSRCLRPGPCQCRRDWARHAPPGPG